MFVLIWVEKNFILAVVFRCGCLESEWVKMHLCHILRKWTSSCSSFRKEGWICNAGVISARFIWACCQDPVFWAVRPSADSFRTRVKPQYAFRKEILLCLVLHKCTLGVLVTMEFPHPHEASMTAHWKWSAFSSKGELQQEAVEKEEERSANSKMEVPQGPPRRPGGGQNTHLHSPLLDHSLVLAQPIRGNRAVPCSSSGVWD